MASFFGSSVSLNRLKSIRPRLPVTFKCLYNAASLSRLTFCVSRKVDVASVVAGTLNDVSSILLAFGVF